jgi:23S rRNA G2445 N2-methylase RlmL
MNWNEDIVVAKTFYGLEGVLSKELEELGFTGVKELNRAVEFRADYLGVLRANYMLRTALSVLKPINNFRIKGKDDLYRGAYNIRWEDIFGADKTIIVRGAVRSEYFPNTQYPALIIKDAICDRFRDKVGSRPSVSTRNADVVIDLHLQDDLVRLSLNTSGKALFQRGYREEKGEAPLNEVLAAGLIKLSGWKGDVPLIDPFCGSGTICIEAGLIAHGLPPQLERNRFSFMSYKNFKNEEWENLKSEYPFRPKRDMVPIIGTDVDGDMIRVARTNLRGTSLAKTVTFNAIEFNDLILPKEKGIMICNPPYGERIGSELNELYGEFGTYLKHNTAGYATFIISSNYEALKQVGLRHSANFKVFNGSLECAFRKYEVFEGKMKEFKTNKA